MHRRAAVSIVIPCHNSAEYVAQCFDSVLAQTFRDFEVIAIDDGSTDETSRVLQQYLHDERVKLVSWTHAHGGPSRARNAGIQNASADILMMLDCDDLLGADAVRAVVDFSSAVPEVGLFFFNSRVTEFESGKEIGLALTDYQSFWRLPMAAAGPGRFIVEPGAAYPQLLRTNFIKTSGTCVSRRAVTEVGPFDENLTNADDWDLWLRVARRYPIGLIDSPAVVYRVRSGSISSRAGRLLPGQIRVLEKQQSLPLDDATRASLPHELAVKHAALGWALRRTGQMASARAHYRRSLAYEWSLMAIRGWALSWATKRSS